MKHTIPLWVNKMSMKLFPSILIVLDVCAAGVCFYHKDYRRGIYWLSAAVLTATVTF